MRVFFLFALLAIGAPVHAQDAAGWGLLGAEIGMVASGAGMVGILAATSCLEDDPSTSSEDEDDPCGLGEAGTMLMSIVAMIGVTGLTALGAVSFALLARDNHWGYSEGFGAAGVLPGIAIGGDIALGLAFGLGRGDPALAAGIAIPIAAAGAPLGYATFEGIASQRDSQPGWAMLGWLIGQTIGQGIFMLGAFAASRSDGLDPWVALLLGFATSACAAAGTAIAWAATQ